MSIRIALLIVTGASVVTFAVVAVVIYAALSMLRSARREKSPMILDYSKASS